jgi:hypothetical protein
MAGLRGSVIRAGNRYQVTRSQMTVTGFPKYHFHLSQKLVTGTSEN